jgi:hypothetical protein
MNTLHSMRPAAWLLPALTLAALALAGCGKADAPAATPAPKTTAAAKAAQPPGDGLPEARCPAKADTALPGPDIAGLKLGMPREEALNFARCLNKQTFVSFENAWIQGLRTHGAKLAPQAFTAQVGETRPCKYSSMDEMQKCGVGNVAWTHVAEKITVVSPGIPGREKVMGIWREQHFKAGEMPAAQALLPALVQKYGPPQFTQSQPGQWMRLDWNQDSAGKPLAAGSPGHGGCRSIGARAQDSHSWSEACGLTLTAMIVLSPENPLVARELNVGLMHQQALYALGTSLQAELKAMQGERQQQEAQQGLGASAKVKL